MVYKGWIACDRKDKVFLESLGIKVGKYSDKSKSFENCYVPLKAFEKLNKHWGRFIWGLEPVADVFQRKDSKV